MSDYEAEPPRESRLPHLPARVVQVVFTPGRLFAALRDDPRSWDALILGVVLVGLANFVLPLEVWEETIREQLTQFGGQMPGDLTVAARTGKIFGTLGIALVWPILAALTAGIYSLIFLFGFGYEGRFRQYFSVTSHALLIAAFGTLLLSPLRIWTLDAQFTLNLGAFVGTLDEGLLSRFLGLLDLFNLWVYALIGLGASIVDGERKAAGSIAVSVGFAALLSLLIASFMG